MVRLRRCQGPRFLPTPVDDAHVQQRRARAVPDERAKETASSVELMAPGRGWVDVHPLVIDDDGTAGQAALGGGWHEFPRSYFTWGHLGEVPVLLWPAGLDHGFDRAGVRSLWITACGSSDAEGMSGRPRPTCECQRLEEGRLRPRWCRIPI